MTKEFCTNLAEYHVPVNADVPPIEVILVPEEDKLVSPIGAKGAGEIGITSAAAALGRGVSRNRQADTAAADYAG